MGLGLFISKLDQECFHHFPAPFGEGGSGQEPVGREVEGDAGLGGGEGGVAKTKELAAQVVGLGRACRLQGMGKETGDGCFL